MMNITQSARLALTSLALTVAMGCDGSGVVPMDDAGVPADAAPLTDGGDAFDPSVTYPGEGQPCEFSLFCAERQMCVDGECVRHERFEPDDLVLGEAVRIPHELFRTSTVYTEAAWDWDDMSVSGQIHSQMLPGATGPVLAFFDALSCQVAIYGAGPARVVHVPDMRCATVGVSPDGYVLLGGMNDDPLNPDGKWALVGPSGAVLAEGGYGAFETRVRAATGNPETQLFSITSILWHEDRFVFSGSASTPTEVPGGTLRIGGAKNPSHTFFGEVSLSGTVELLEPAGSTAHAGSFGWIVRDAGGLHSILTVFDALIEPTSMSIDVLNWETGERETLVEGAAGQVAGTSRYFQPSSSTWTLVTLQANSACAQELFTGTEHTGALWMTPEDRCVEGRPPTLTHENLIGSSSTAGAAFSASSEIPWLLLDYRDGDMVPILYTIGNVEVMSFEHAEPALRYLDSIHAVARFGRTLEVFAQATNDADGFPRLSYWEFLLSRGSE